MKKLIILFLIFIAQLHAGKIQQSNKSNLFTVLPNPVFANIIIDILDPEKDNASERFRNLCLVCKDFNATLNNSQFLDSLVTIWPQSSYYPASTLYKTLGENESMQSSVQLSLALTLGTKRVAMWQMENSLIRDLSLLLKNGRISDYVLHIAIRYKKNYHLDEFLKHPHININIKDEITGNTPLMSAIITQNAYAIEQLLKRKDLNVFLQNNYKETAAQLARASGMHKLAEELEALAPQRTRCCVIL